MVRKGEGVGNFLWRSDQVLKKTILVYKEESKLTKVTFDNPLTRALNNFLDDYTLKKIPFMYSFFWELRGLCPNFYPYSCVCEQFIYSQDRSTYFLPQNRQIDCGNVQIAHRHMYVEIGIVAAQFLFWEYLFKIFSIGS